MAISCACPGCSTAFRVTDELAGKRVKCPKCLMVFTLPAAVPEPVAAAPEPPPVKKVAAPVNDLFREPEPRDSSRKASRRDARDRDDDRDSDPDNDLPRSRRKAKRASGSAMPWVLGLVGAAVLLFVLCGGAAAVIGIAAFSGEKKAAAVKPNQPFAVPPGQFNPPIPQPPPVVAPPPAVPQVGGKPVVHAAGTNLPPGAPNRAIRVTQFAGNLQIQSQLTLADAVFANGPNQGFGNNNKRCKEYVIDLTAGRQYVIDLESNQFDAFLHLEDLQGQLIAQNDDIAPGNLNSRIIWTPNVTASYVIVATSLGGGVGQFNFVVRDSSLPK